MRTTETNAAKEPIQVSKIRTLFDLYQKTAVDVRLVGSWGRAAVFDTPLPPTLGDYGGYRDIDATILSGSELKRRNTSRESRRLSLPVVFEEHFSSQIRSSANIWTIHYRDLHYEVHPDIFKTNTVNIFDFTVNSFDPKTLLYINYLYGPTRPQDTAVWDHFQPIAQQISLLPDSLFDPFIQMDHDRKINYPREAQWARLRWEYHSRLPLRARKILGIITVPLWNKLTNRQ